MFAANSKQYKIGPYTTSEKEIKDLVGEVLKRKLDITIINESPDPIGDAYKMKRILETLKTG